MNILALRSDHVLCHTLAGGVGLIKRDMSFFSTRGGVFGKHDSMSQ